MVGSYTSPHFHQFNCTYPHSLVKAGVQTNGMIKIIGAIDNEKIKEEITLVTEGGRAAFKLRMDKYGF